MTTILSNNLFIALQNAGFPKPYILKMLPDWWTEDLMNDPTVRIELDLSLSRMFGLNLRDLLNETPTVTFDVEGSMKYKRSRRLDGNDLTGATALLQSIAKMVNASMPHPYCPLPQDPLQVRQEILSAGAKFISLMSVVDYLWSKGIPTIHVSELPEGLKKMDGLALRIGDRPIVILSKQSPFRAWNLFIAAHELAHCSLGHIEIDEVLVDFSIGQDCYLLADDDPEELAADQFAIALLNGEDAIQYVSEREVNSNELVDAALRRQRTHHVDAGHVILNYGYRNNAWKVSQAALKKIDHSDARVDINEYLFSRLKLKMLPASSAEFLFKVTGSLNR